MKKFVSLVIVLVLTITIVNAQDSQQVKNLTTFAKVWGFLKYYHPDMAKGNPDCDKELARMIPLVKSAKSGNELNKVLSDWYNSLPKAKVANDITQLRNDTIVRIFDEKDIRNFGVSKTMEAEFIRLYLYHLPDSSKYITDHYKQYHLDYISQREEESKTPAFPDEEHRLLALFRYWNVINYFYPYKKINAADWEAVLPAFIPRFMACRDSNEYRKTFIQLSARLKDSHSFFQQASWDKEHYGLRPPFDLSQIDGKYYISRTTRKALMEQMGLKIGDEVTAINGRPVADRANDLKPYITGTNQESVNRNVAYYLLRIDTNHAMQLTIMRGGTSMDKKIRLFTYDELRKHPRDIHPKIWEDRGNGVWYVRICEIQKPDTLKKLFADLQQAKTVIWDMRDYPSFQVVSVMGPGLYAQRPASTISYNDILAFPGAMTKHTEKAVFFGKDTLNLQLYKGRMIVLVNEQTQSLSESIAYELRFRPNTMVMGSKTAGTTGNITWLSIPGDILVSYTGVGVEGLCGSFKEGKGVKIDKEVKLSAKNLLEYPDYMLDVAYKEALKHQ